MNIVWNTASGKTLNTRKEIHKKGSKSLLISFSNLHLDFVVGLKASKGRNETRKIGWSSLEIGTSVASLGYHQGVKARKKMVRKKKNLGFFTRGVKKWVVYR